MLHTIILVLAVVAFALAALQPALFPGAKIVLRDVGFALVTLSLLV